MNEKKKKFRRHFEILLKYVKSAHSRTHTIADTHKSIRSFFLNQFSGSFTSFQMFT